MPLKKLKGWKREKEFDTTTIATDMTQLPESVSGETKETVNRKSLGEAEIKITAGQKTQVYEPRPLTPDDDIYEDIIEQFASAPTKPKYWFEEFGDYWSCSCGHINKGDHCKSCGLSRDLLRSLFILHKPGYAASKLDKKVKRAQKKVDQEEQQYLEKESRRKAREASGEDLTIVTPIEPAPAPCEPINDDGTRQIERADTVQAEKGNTQAPAENQRQAKQNNALQTEQNSAQNAETESMRQATHGSAQQAGNKDFSQMKNNGTQRATQNSEAFAHDASQSAPGQIGIKLTRDEPNPDGKTAPSAPLQESATAIEHRQNAGQTNQNENAPLQKGETAASGQGNARKTQQGDTIQHPPAKIKFKEINVAETAGAGKTPGKKRAVIIAAIAICLVLVGVCGYIIYAHMAAPAMKYEDAQELQAAGKYQQAIETYESLADYKDSQKRIWQCYISMGDDQYTGGKYEKAIKTYQKALKLKESKKIDEKIRNCYIAIGDRQYANGEYENALKTYTATVSMGDSDELQEKINAAKFAYVKAFQADRSSQVEQYMAELMELKYPGIQEIYDAYYAWHVKIVANTSETDYSTDIDTASRKDTVYFHALISGGEPNESVELYYEVTWPNGSKQIYGLDSRWQDGSKITARFQYPIPLFGKEGKLTFTLYDKNTNEVMGNDSITFEN